MQKIASAIHAGWLIDGSGNDIQDNVVLLLRDGIIDAIIPHADWQPEIAPLQHDLSFATLLPPLIDCHVHLTMSASSDPRFRKEQQQAGPEQLVGQLERNLAYHFSHGVWAVRDGGDHYGLTQNKGGALAASQGERLRVFACGQAWHQQGRYGKMFGQAPAPGERLADACQRCPSDARWLKIFQSGPNSLTEDAPPATPQFTAEELREAVQWAHGQGKKVMVHANGEKPVRTAIAAGCDSLEHGYSMGEENLRLLAEKRITWVPTLYAMKALANLSEVTPGQRRVAEKTLRHQLAQVRLASTLEVPIACGTDAGSAGVLHGEAVAEEIKLLIKAGLSLPAAVHAATAGAADLLGIMDFGLIAAGKPAHFLVTRGGPSFLPRKLFYLEGIFRGGQPDPLYRKEPRR